MIKLLPWGAAIVKMDGFTPDCGLEISLDHLRASAERWCRWNKTWRHRLFSAGEEYVSMFGRKVSVFGWLPVFGEYRAICQRLVSERHSEAGFCYEVDYSLYGSRRTGLITPQHVAVLSL